MNLEPVTNGEPVSPEHLPEPLCLGAQEGLPSGRWSLFGTQLIWRKETSLAFSQLSVGQLSVSRVFWNGQQRIRPLNLGALSSEQGPLAFREASL